MLSSDETLTQKSPNPKVHNKKRVGAQNITQMIPDLLILAPRDANWGNKSALKRCRKCIDFPCFLFSCLCGSTKTVPALQHCSWNCFSRQSLFKWRGLYRHHHRARVLSWTSAQGSRHPAPSESRAAPR